MMTWHFNTYVYVFGMSGSWCGMGYERICMFMCLGCLVPGVAWGMSASVYVFGMSGSWCGMGYERICLCVWDVWFLVWHGVWAHLFMCLGCLVPGVAWGSASVYVFGSASVYVFGMSGSWCGMGYERICLCVWDVWFLVWHGVWAHLFMCLGCLVPGVAWGMSASVYVFGMPGSWCGMGYERICLCVWDVWFLVWHGVWAHLFMCLGCLVPGVAWGMSASVYVFGMSGSWCGMGYERICLCVWDAWFLVWHGVWAHLFMCLGCLVPGVAWGMSASDFAWQFHVSLSSHFQGAVMKTAIWLLTRTVHQFLFIYIFVLILYVVHTKCLLQELNKAICIVFVFNGMSIIYKVYVSRYFQHYLYYFLL